MKKVLISILILLSSFLAMAQDGQFTKLFDQVCPGETSDSRQGMAVCGGYMFQFRDRNCGIDVYSMNDGAFQGRIILGGEKTYHNNNASVSAFYYADGDEFPLIYASQENILEHKVVAYRIYRNAEGFAVQKVQVINLPSPLEMGVYYPNAAPDVQNGLLYVLGYSRESWKSADANSIVMLQMHLPSPFEGEEVTLTTADILRRTSMPFRVATQGFGIRNGRLYQLYGVPRYGKTSLCCVNLAESSVEWEKQLDLCGCTSEPEGLSFHKGEIVFSDVKGGVYATGVKVPWQISEDLAATAPALARGAVKRLVCMDLDATLTQHRSPLETPNLHALRNLDNRYKCIMVGAGNCQRIYRQMGGYPIDILGNYGMQEAHIVDGELVTVKQLTQKVDTAFFNRKTDYLRKKYGYTQIYGKSVEYHPSGMVTFALLGTEAPTAQKVVFDPDKAKRKAMYPEVLKIFRNYSVFIGGSSSFDFAGKKFNKYDAVARYAKENGYSLDEVIFIGDDFGDGGGDSHIRINGLDYINIRNYKDFPLEIVPLLLQD